MRREKIIISQIDITHEAQNDCINEYRNYRYVVNYTAVYLNLTIQGTITKKQVPKLPVHLREMIVADILRQINA